MIKHSFFSKATVSALVLAAGAAFALPPESVQLENAQVPDTTPQQKYQTMRNEAYGGLKINLEACRAEPAAGRGACVKEARALFQRDMAAARDILSNPSASTSVAIRSDIRSTETPVKTQ